MIKPIRRIILAFTVGFVVGCGGGGNNSSGEVAAPPPPLPPPVTPQASDLFVWPIDPGAPTRGDFGACGDSAGGCFWLANTDRNVTSVWRDVQPFQREATSSGRWHLGADYNLGGGTDDSGLSVHATADGVVARVETNVCGWGNVVFLRHETSAGPVVSMYAHVEWLASGAPAKDTLVKRGDPIAVVGNGAWSANASCASSGSYPYHLHFEIRDRDNIEIGVGYSAAQDGKGPESQIDPNVFIAGHLAAVYAVGADSGLYRVSTSAAGRDELVGTIRTSSGLVPTFLDIATASGEVFGSSGSLLYSIDPLTAVAREIGSGFGVAPINALGSDVSGNLLGATTSGTFVRINKSDGLAQVFGAYGYVSAGDLAIAPSGVAYATVAASSSGSRLMIVRLTDGAASPVGVVPDTGFANVFSLVFSEGTLFGLTSDASGGGSLLQIDTATGVAARVRSLSFAAR